MQEPRYRQQSGFEGEASAVLVFSIGSLGDTVVALPAFHAVRRQYSGARVVLLTNTPVGGGAKAASAIEVLENSGLVDDFIAYPHGQFAIAQLIRVILRLRASRARTAVYLMQRRTRAQMARDYLFFQACGVKRIVGMKWNRTSNRPPTHPDGLWESEACRQLRNIGIDRPVLSRKDFFLNLLGQERKDAEQQLRSAGIEGDYLVVCAGTKVSVKDWGEDRWIDFVERLAAASPPLSLVLIGSKDEGDRSARLAEGWPWRTANLCGRLTPRQSAALLEGARLFVGHDSGPMHLAAAVGTVTVSVFASREMPGVWFPFGQEQHVFYTDVPCRDCRLDECIEHRKRCIRDIRPADVARRAAALLPAAVALKSGT